MITGIGHGPDFFSAGDPSQVPLLARQALCWLSHLSSPGSVFLESPVFPNSANFSIKDGQSCNLAQDVKPVLLEKSSQNPGILVTHPVLGFNL